MSTSDDHGSLEQQQQQDQEVQKTEKDLSLHAAVLDWDNESEIVRLLINGADPNAVNMAGLTPLHIMSSSRLDQYDNYINFCDEKFSRLIDLFFEINDTLSQQVLMNARSVYGCTPLHCAVRAGFKRVMIALLRRGADPNLADDDGYTALHYLTGNDRDVAVRFFDVAEDMNLKLRVDARTKRASTPLHLAVGACNQYMIRMLLERGADPNSVNEDGTTLLHLLCKYYNVDEEHNMAEMFFEMAENQGQSVLVNAQDRLGDTALHKALAYGRKTPFKWLLQHGANPNLANKDGSTPLHISCCKITVHNNYNDEYAKVLFEFANDEYRPLKVDARDSRGLTPLQLAVTIAAPKIVGMLLDHGADLSSFVFPSVDQLEEGFKKRIGKYFPDFELLNDTKDVVERLTARGYQLKRSDAVTITSAFAKLGLLKKPTGNDMDELWLLGEMFEEMARNPRLGCDLSTFKVVLLHEQEQLARSFCRPLALDSLLSLTGYRLPILCCEIIIDYVDGEDLLHISLADQDQSS